jgi:hypothetical protein
MANESYLVRGTPVVWTDTTGDLAITLNNLAANAVRVGARKDWGAGAQPDEYAWRATVQFDTAPVVGETVDIFISTSDGTEEDGQVGTADAAGTTDKLRNLMFIGSVVVTSTSATTDMTASGICRIPTRYCSVVVHNNTVDALEATNNVSEVTLTPIYHQIQ